MARGGAKIIKKSISATSDEDMQSLNAMFAQITGASNADKEVLIPKICKIYRSINTYYKLCNILLKFDLFTSKFTEYSFWFEDIEVFLKNLVSSTGIDMAKKYTDDIEHHYHSLDNEELNTFYKKLKDNEFIKQIIITGSNLSQYKKYLTNIVITPAPDAVSQTPKLNDKFIGNEPGITLQPLSFSTLDLKIVWNTEGFMFNDKKFILNLLKRIYETGIEVYDVVSSPDVNIKKFSTILVGSIAKLKKQIPRCDKAFAIIEKSVSTLETNFKGYFRDSVEASNPSIIIESFIVDISTSQKANASIASEFKRIIMFLQKNSANNNDPKLKKLFSMLNTQFSAMDVELGIKKTTDVRVAPDA